jgi:hypothetical protein
MDLLVLSVVSEYRFVLLVPRLILQYGPAWGTRCHGTFAVNSLQAVCAQKQAMYMCEDALMQCRPMPVQLYYA